MSSTTLSIQGMKCAGCAAKVEQALRGVPGVAGVSVDLEHATAEVEGGGEAHNLVSAVQTAGFRAQALPNTQQNPSMV